MSFTYEYQYFDEETEKTYDVEVELTNYFEPNYGADADGRRGMAMDFVEVDEFRVLLDGVEVTDKEVIMRAERDYERNHDRKACDECAEAYHEPPEREYDEFD